MNTAVFGKLESFYEFGSLLLAVVPQCPGVNGKERVPFPTMVGWETF